MLSEKTDTAKAWEQHNILFCRKKGERKKFSLSSPFLTQVFLFLFLVFSSLYPLLGTSPNSQSSHILIFWSNFYPAGRKVRQRKSKYCMSVLSRQWGEDRIPSSLRAGKIRGITERKVFREDLPFLSDRSRLVTMHSLLIKLISTWREKKMK